MAKRANGEEPTFEQALAEVERIVQTMEQGEVPLAESLEQYARGVEMIKRCRRLLAEAEKKIELLSEPESGQTRPFEPPG